MQDAAGLMAFFSDIDEDFVEEYRRWHNCEHMAERVAVPGFRQGLRYRGEAGAPMFLMLYETNDTGVLASPAYHATLNAPTPWTQEALRHFRKPVRTIYGLAASVGMRPRFPAPYLAAVRFNGGSQTPEMLCHGTKGAGVLRVRLWQVDEAVSGIMTSERRIYGGGPGQQQYLLLCELAAPDAPVLHPEGAGDLFVDRFWLDFVLDAPGAG